MEGARQFRLLLWKDYLTRRRNLVTVGGVLWAVLFMLSLYAVRKNIDNEDFPSCQFSARALPSAGILTFLQSFICSVNNECNSMTKYDEIPTYENSKLTQLQRQLSPLLDDERVLDVAGSAPNALKLLAKLANVVDEPTFVHITKHGVKVRDLFTNPERAAAYLTAQLELPEELVDSLMDSPLSLQGITAGNIDRCNAKSLSDTIMMENKEQLQQLVQKLCSLSSFEIQKTMMGLMLQVNFSKYIKMMGEMYSRVSGDSRVSSLGDTATAVVRVMDSRSYSPLQAMSLVAEPEVSYFDLDFIPRLLDQFRPTFGDTDFYKSLREYVDIFVVGLKYVNKLLQPSEAYNLEGAKRVAGLVLGTINKNNSLDDVVNKVDSAFNTLDSIVTNSTDSDFYDIASKLSNFVLKLVSNQTQHDVKFYSTLLAKLLEAMDGVLRIDNKIEEIAYNVTLRHPEGFNMFLRLSPDVVARGFDALTDAERTQVITKNFSNTEDMFCNNDRIQRFFQVPRTEAESIQKQLCNDAWKEFVADLIRSFGVYEVKDKINTITSLMVQETIGKDVTSQLYSIEQDFKVLKTFANTAMDMELMKEVNWEPLVKDEGSEVMKVVMQKRHLSTQILITVHGALAKEVVTQNTLLNFKVSPALRDVTILLVALNKQLDTTPLDLVAAFKRMYPTIATTFLNTFLNEDKTYKCLSSPVTAIACNGVEDSRTFLEMQDEAVLPVICNATHELERALHGQSHLGRAIKTIMSAKHTPFGAQVNWTTLIEGVKNLYIKLNKDYPYMLRMEHGMTAELQAQMKSTVKKLKIYWFGRGRFVRSMHLGFKLILRGLDLVDYDVFNMRYEVWAKLKYMVRSVGGAARVFNEVLRVTAGALHNRLVTSELPSSTGEAVTVLVPALPSLIVDATDMLVNDTLQVSAISRMLNSSSWPCSNTTRQMLPLSDTRAERVLTDLLCINKTVKSWKDYLNENNATIYSFQLQDYNRTRYQSHLFLKFSSTVDELLSLTAQVKDGLRGFFNGSIVYGNMTLVSAWDYAIRNLNNTNRNENIRKFLSKVDIIVNSIETPVEESFLPLSTLWEKYMRCLSTGGDCAAMGRSAWGNILRFSSTTLLHLVTDFHIYITEMYEPDSNLLQIFGFNKGTPLYIIFDEFSDFMMVLINSYMDYGFMSQIRKASQTEFWDCEAVVRSLAPPPLGRVGAATLRAVRPYVCPGIFYWLGLPRGENTLLDVVAKPQYYLFTAGVNNLKSDFESAFNKSTELITFLFNISNNPLTEEEIRNNTLLGKLKTSVDNVLNYKLDDTDPGYVEFNNITKKQIATMIYLTKVVAIANKLATHIDRLKLEDVTNGTDDTDKMKEDLDYIKRVFRRKPTEAIAFHFDVITELLWVNGEDRLIEIMNRNCGKFKVGDDSKDILSTTDIVKSKFCETNYSVVYDAVQEIVMDDFESAKMSLNKLVIVLKDENEDLSDIVKFLKKRSPILEALQKSIEYSYELTLPIYLKYLHSNIQQYEIILAFLTGDDWWKKLREEYSGPNSEEFLDGVEKSFGIAEDLLNNFDNIHLVRLLRDLNTNNTDMCQTNLSVSDYCPDGTGTLNRMKSRMCQVDRIDVYKEIPPLVFASQGYENELELPTSINYTALDLDLSIVDTKLELILNGPHTPERPSWIKEQDVDTLRKYSQRLSSKESLVKLYFGGLGNIADAMTLFLNNSECKYCSQFTSWFKQLNLQLVKKREYDGLFCHLDDLHLEEVHHTLKNNFHWDISIEELLSTRNYTNLELNKAVNQLLEQTKLHILDDLSANSSTLARCLNWNVTSNEFGNGTLLIKIISNTIKLLRAELPHLSEIDGITAVPFLNELYTDVAHNIDVHRPLKDYMKNAIDNLKVDKEVLTAIDDGELNLRLAMLDYIPVTKYLTLRNASWLRVCSVHDCNRLHEAITNNLNKDSIENDLPRLQKQEFWQFKFVTDILGHVELMLRHVARLAAVASGVDIAGVMEGRVEALVDFMMYMLMDDTAADLIYSIQGVLDELRPIIRESPLEHDLEALVNGIRIMQDLKNYLLEQDELKLEVSRVFSHPEHIESSLSALGIKNTNFWSIAAPRIYAGHLHLKPLFAKQRHYHISSFVCQFENMSKVIIPGNLDVVTLDDVYGAVVEQFCNLKDEQAKQLVPVLMANLNFSFILDKVSKVLLSKLYTAANLTQTEGELVLQKFPEMMQVLPLIQEKVGVVSKTLANETLFKSLKDSNSIGNLLTSQEFLNNAGNMMCGRPFFSNIGKFYKLVAETTDFSNKPDPRQLEALPTDFCRSLYKDVLKVHGGKIVWSFVKPLIMGKILYTPPTTPVHKIIAQANSSLSMMYQLTGLVHSFANSFSSVEELGQHREGVAALKRALAAPGLRGLGVAFPGLEGDDPLPDLDLNGMLDEFGDLKEIGSLLHKGSSLLRCVNLDRFVPVVDEKTLAHQAVLLTGINEFSAGLVFNKAVEEDNKLIDIEYKIRMDIESVPTTSRKRNQYWTPGPEGNFLEDMRYFRGFVQIQDIVDKAIIDLASNSSGREKREAEMKSDDDWPVYTQQIPYPCYRKDYYQSTVYESQALIVVFFFCLVFSVASAVRFVVADQESGNVMLMSVMGVRVWCVRASWAAATLVEAALTSAALTLLLRAGRVLPRTDVSLLLALLFAFSLSVIAFCYMLSKLFKSASFAAVCAALVYMVSFMPYVIVVAMEASLSLSSKILTCLSMSSAFSYCLLQLARMEARGAGALWRDAWPATAPGDISLGMAAAMIIIDAIIYFVIGFTIDKFFGLHTLRSSITYCNTSSEKTGVSIVNVSKIYRQGSRHAKTALDNVSIELHKGQITTLLGHNGAGKTTLIKILTGMERPSKGDVVLHGAAPARVGVCPQRDVLFECLTAREHLALYAQLKSGRPLIDLQEEIDSVLDALSLRGRAGELARALSGGLRRRLCVALAFVAQPALVMLDEPTAGVDPAARREIWTMIMKLKEDRTVLLTTHHLDEAELLSDQIVILNKGQVHTTGSPIEIKRTLGTGYKLAVTYDSTDEVTVEERSKHLLAVVRDVIKNAYVNDVTTCETELTLPFFDANGLNNDFLALCTSLESLQEQLGFTSYSMECSSLEQVFTTVCEQDAHISLSPAHSASSTHSDESYKTVSTASMRESEAPLVPLEGALRGSHWEQFTALLHARYLHYTRNGWLLFLLIVLPALFVTIAMAFSMIRPPADNEVALLLTPDMYDNSTQFIVPHHSKDASNEPAYITQIMDNLVSGKQVRNWTNKDSPLCKCMETRQECEVEQTVLPEMMSLPDVGTLNEWLLASQEVYIEKRYGGYSWAAQGERRALVAWYNNKGHHALPAATAALRAAALRARAPRASLRTYTHPLKISTEQLTKSTVLQHVADAGITAMVLVSACLVCAGGTLYAVRARASQFARLHLLCGVAPAVALAVALLWDLMIMFVNMVITACLMKAFGFPVFVFGNNLPAICILMMLFGYSCGCVVHLLQRLFSEPSLANMVLFCGNFFVGLVGIASLLILDIISESDETDAAREVLHQVLMVFPQFVFADALLEIAKNTIKAQVLSRFGMDTYQDPLHSELIQWHYVSLACVGTGLLLLILAIDYHCFDWIRNRFRLRARQQRADAPEPAEVEAERERVRAAAAREDAPHAIPTIGYINAGYTVGEEKRVKGMMAREGGDAAACLRLSKWYPGLRAAPALHDLTLGIPYGQCTALLGQNGAGKSTTFKLLTGALQPDAGHLRLAGRVATAKDLRAGNISYCPQTDAVDALLTARETLRLYCRLRGLRDQDAVIKRTLDAFGLRAYADVRCGALSGGTRRKLCTAVAFMARTSLVLLDEPTSGMDVTARGLVCAATQSACRAGRALLVSTHALRDARSLAARVALLRAARLHAIAHTHSCLDRFGGGYVVCIRTRHAREAWRALRGRSPGAQLQAHHARALQVLLPHRCTVEGKEVVTRLSDVFRLMARLQSECDVEDFTVDQSSLDQMFLSLSNDTSQDLDLTLEPLPTPMSAKMCDEELTSVTSL